MARANDLWFEFAGVSSAAMNVKLLALPNRRRAALRTDDNPYAPGRDGSLWLPGSGYEDFELPVRAQLIPGASPTQISAWLTGIGWLRFSDVPDRAYRARASGGFEYAHVSGRPGGQIIEASFLCHPFSYAYPEPAPLALSNGGTLVNPGTAEAQPVIYVAGSGDAALTIGVKTLRIFNLASAIAIDVAAGKAFNGAADLTDSVGREDWPMTIPPGAHPVSWTGGITGVTIDPRWRDL